MTQGDSQRRRCFEALFRDHVVGIASYCRWQLRLGEDADDAVAEVFLIAWRRLDDVPSGQAARPWLYATARRVVANQARSASRRKRLQERLNAQPAPAQRSDDPIGARVHEALATLDPRDREILFLAECEGLAPAEIAEVMRRSAVTIRVRLHRARHRLRAAFEPEEADHAAGGRVPTIVGRCEP